MSHRSTQDDPLSGVAKIVVVVLVVCLGLWGCARKPDSRLTSSERVRVLESRCQKLEQDYRSVAQARDKARRELAALEEETTRLHKELAEKVALQKERDQLREQMKASLIEQEELTQLLALRTGERDELRQLLIQRTHEREQLQSRCDKFRKGLQQLLTQDDNPAPPAPVMTPVPTAIPGGPTLSME